MWVAEWFIKIAVEKESVVYFSNVLSGCIMLACNIKWNRIYDCVSSTAGNSEALV